MALKNNILVPLPPMPWGRGRDKVGTNPGLPPSLQVAEPGAPWLPHPKGCLLLLAPPFHGSICSPLLLLSARVLPVGLPRQPGDSPPPPARWG